MKANDCAMQHIKSFREQAIGASEADFGEPCQNCIHAENCDFNWLSILSPLMNQSDVKINMVVQEPIPQRDILQNGIAKDRDIQHRGGNKNW